MTHTTLCDRHNVVHLGVKNGHIQIRIQQNVKLSGRLWQQYRKIEYASIKYSVDIPRWPSVPLKRIIINLVA